MKILVFSSFARRNDDGRMKEFSDNAVHIFLFPFTPSLTFPLERWKKLVLQDSNDRRKGQQSLESEPREGGKVTGK